VLREQGAAALKTQLADTVPFVEALFTRERDSEPLDTPERRAGLKQRLRAAAAAIVDKDLGGLYRDDLLGRMDALFPREAPRPFTPGRPAGRGGFGGKPFIPTSPMAESRVAARRLAGGIDATAAALIKYALDDPHVLDDHLEDLQSWGFGDQALAGLTGEIIRLRLEADHLDSEALARHLASRGYSAQLNDIDRAAPNSGAPFLKSDVTLAAARSQWSHALSVLNRLAALEVALTAAKHDLAGGADAAGLMGLKTERDALRRAVKTGTIWSEDLSS
jgi:DNA primase